MWSAACAQFSCWLLCVYWLTEHVCVLHLLSMAQIFIFDVAQCFPVHPHGAPPWFCVAQRLAGERIASLVIPTIWTGNHTHVGSVQMKKQQSTVKKTNSTCSLRKKALFGPFSEVESRSDADMAKQPLNPWISWNIHNLAQSASKTPKRDNEEFKFF